MRTRAAIMVDRDRAVLVFVHGQLVTAQSSMLLERDNHLATFMIAHLSVIPHLGAAILESTETAQ